MRQYQFVNKATNTVRTFIILQNNTTTSLIGTLINLKSILLILFYRKQYANHVNCTSVNRTLYVFSRPVYCYPMVHGFPGLCGQVNTNFSQSIVQYTSYINQRPIQFCLLTFSLYWPVTVVHEDMTRDSTRFLQCYRSLGKLQHMLLTISSIFCIVLSVRNLSVLRGHSVLSSPPQRPLTPPPHTHAHTHARTHAHTHFHFNLY